MMTLRSRLLAGVAAIVVVLGVAGTLVIRTQNRYLIGQLDARLRGYARSSTQVVARLGGFGAGRPGGPPGALSEVYIGRFSANRPIETLLTPAGDPGLVPIIGPSLAVRRPTTVGTVSGVSPRVRALASTLPDGSVAVFALPTRLAEQAIRRLLATTLLAATLMLAMIGLIASWVHRFGLRPIRQMTDAADAITAGATGRRVDTLAGHTEAARLGRALNLMIDTSRDAETRLRRFVADASHELRTPLTTLSGYAALHQSGRLTEPAAVNDAMTRIASESKRMAAMVDDLLRLADLDERHPLTLETIDLTQLVHDLAADQAALDPTRPLTTTTPDTAMVNGDAHQITQALAALLTNARRHTPPGTPIELRVTPLDGSVRVEITDCGPGIDPQHLPHLFERFYRADAGRTRTPTSGTGLGLAIVAAILDNHHGNYGATSQPGQGATFWITLPTKPKPR